MTRSPLRSTALALAAVVTCAGTAAWSAPAPPTSASPRPGPVLSTHLDYGRYVVTIDPTLVERAGEGTAAAWGPTSAVGSEWLARP
jgi:hypothetical protein